VKRSSQEKAVSVAGGWPMLVVNLAILLGGVFLFIAGVRSGSVTTIVPGVLMWPLAVVMLNGHFALQPNEARVLILFGEYRGTVRSSGFHWANPFMSRQRGGSMLQIQTQLQAAANVHGQAAAPTTLHARFGTKISLRAQTLNGDRLKVNDKRGNPIEIAAMVSNLLVVLCGDNDVSPVINAGTLYS
jgi:hypothetical protein